MCRDWWPVLRRSRFTARAMIAENHDREVKTRGLLLYYTTLCGTGEDKSVVMGMNEVQAFGLIQLRKLEHLSLPRVRTLSISAHLHRDHHKWRSLYGSRILE